MKKFTALILGILLTLCVAAFAACKPLPEDKPPNGDKPPDGWTAPSVIINQMYGRGFDRENLNNRASAGSHSFVELYNTGTTDVDLKGYSLHAGNNSDWNGLLELNGTIPAKHSFLVRVNHQPANSALSPNLIITDFDQAWPVNAFSSTRIGFDNKNLKVLLKYGTASLGEVTNPFNTDGTGRKVEGYVDMLAVSGNDSYPQGVNAFETSSTKRPAPTEFSGLYDTVFGQSRQKAARRKFFTDTNDSYDDVKIIDYRANRLSAAGLAAYRPRSLKDAVWTNIDDRVGHIGHLIINQIYGRGTQDEAAATHSFIELYNPTNSRITLTGWSLQSGEPGSAAWDVLELNLKTNNWIEPRHSALILIKNASALDSTSRLRFADSDADQIWEVCAVKNTPVILRTNGIKVALMKNTAQITVANPFASSALAQHYVDMIGITGNNNNTPLIDGRENDALGQSQGNSRQRAARRNGFADTDNNLDDIENIDYRLFWIDEEGEERGTHPFEFELFRPRNRAFGQWGNTIV